MTCCTPLGPPCALDSLLAEHCAPVLLGCKPANLVSVCRRRVPALPGLLAQCQTREVSSALVRAVLQVKNHPRH